MLGFTGRSGEQKVKPCTCANVWGRGVRLLPTPAEGSRQHLLLYSYRWSPGWGLAHQGWSGACLTVQDPTMKKRWHLTRFNTKPPLFAVLSTLFNKGEWGPNSLPGLTRELSAIMSREAERGYCGLEIGWGHSSMNLLSLGLLPSHTLHPLQLTRHLSPAPSPGH